MLLILIFSRVIALKDKNDITITNAFQKILKNLMANEIWVDKGSEFYSRWMKSWLKKNDTEMYSAHNDGKSVAAERFIRTLKNVICKYMTLIPKKVYIDKLDDIVNEYNNRYHRTIKKNVWCKIKGIYWL